MATNETETPPLEVLAYLVGWLALVIASVWLIPRTIVAIGAALWLGAGGAAAAAAAAPWIAPVASAGLGVTGATLLILVLVKASKEAKAEPYEWIVPILGIGGALLLDLAKEFAVDNTLLKLVFTAVIAFLFVVAGSCWARGGATWKVVAAALMLVPPTLLFVQNLDATSKTTFAENIASVPIGAWVRVAGFLVIGGVTALLHHLCTRSKRLY